MKSKIILGFNILKLLGSIVLLTGCSVTLLFILYCAYNVLSYETGHSFVSAILTILIGFGIIAIAIDKVKEDDDKALAFKNLAKNV